MLINNSYKDPEQTKKINALVGPPYPLAERMKMRGVGSPKMHINSASVEINNILILDNSTNTCNVELRPKGIMIGFQKRLETYLLIIPFYKLSLYKGKADEYSFFKDHYFIKIKATKNDIAIHKFIKKIMNLKADNSYTNIEDL